MVIEITGSQTKVGRILHKQQLMKPKKALHGITGLEITDMTAKVDPNTNRITQYRAAVKIAFGVEHES